MTTPTSGNISLTDIMNELRVSNSGRAYPITLGDTDVRTLAGVSSGTITFSNLYNKSSYTNMVLTGVNGSSIVSSGTSGGTCTCQPGVTVANGLGPFTYSWSFTTQAGTTLTNATSQYCNISKTYLIHTTGSATAVLTCTVTDSTSNTATVTGVQAYLEWDNNS